MLKPVFKVLLYGFLVIIIAGLSTSCTKKDFPHKNTTLKDSLATDSIARQDSLPSFNIPVGVAVDASGNVYVTDYGNNLIRKITPGGLVSTLAGNGFQGSLDSNSVSASFNRPAGITADASGNLYIADSGNNTIRKVTAAGLVTTIAGSDSTGYADGQGTAALFFDPLGLTVTASGSLYVADAGNNLIRLVSPNGAVSTFAGTTDSLTSNGTPSPSLLDNPSGIASDGAGNLYVANYLDNDILKVNPSGSIIKLAGNGNQGSANGPDSTATFYLPNSLAVDAAGNIYVSDGVNNLIRKITTDGMVSTLAGSGTAGATDSTGTAASFDGPAGIAVDANGYVYVADSNNNLIRRISPAGVVTTFAGSGLPGAKNGQVMALKRKKLVKHLSASHSSIWLKPKKHK